jgi:hypothetical protein
VRNTVILVLAAVIVLVSAVPASAAALVTPANGVNLSSGYVAFTWSLEFNETSSVLETSRKPDLDNDDYFADSTLFYLPDESQTAFTTREPLHAGKHYWHLRYWQEDINFGGDSYVTPLRILNVRPHLKIISGSGSNSAGGWWGNPTVSLRIKYRTNLESGGALVCKLKRGRKTIRTVRRSIDYDYMKPKITTCDLSYPPKYSGKMLRYSASLRGMGKRVGRTSTAWKAL